MKVYEFGDKQKPAILLLPGTCCYWKSNFGHVIEPLQKNFYVCCVSYDGFDDTEDTEFPSMLEETVKIENYIKEKHGGHVRAVYGCSLGGSFVGLLAARENIRMDYGILGGSDLDQAGVFKTKLLCKIAMPLLYPFIHDGQFRQKFMQKKMQKTMENGSEYEKIFMNMMKTPEGKSLSFISRESVERQFASDMVTPLPDHISPKHGEIHIIYALKMGEKYRKRYYQHFAKPVLHEFNMKHEELLACHKEEWVRTIEEICIPGA